MSCIGETVFKKKQDVSECESDIWDDTLLIQAYDNAVSVMKAKLSGQGIEIGPANETNLHNSSSKNTAKRKKKKKNKNKDKSKERSLPVDTPQWVVGSHCRAVFTEDGEIYEAVIQSIDKGRNNCVVRFLGYGNEEEQDLADLLPSSAVKGRSRRQSEVSETLSEGDPVMEWQFRGRRGSSGSSRGRGLRMPPPLYTHSGTSNWGTPPSLPPWAAFPGPQNPFQTFPGMVPPAFTSLPQMPPPPPPPIEDLDVSDNDMQALQNMMISWYMSGYHTGYYQGLKDSKKSAKKASGVKEKKENAAG